MTQFMQTLRPRIPDELLGNDPAKDGPKISPDGTKLAYVSYDGGAANIWIETMGAADAKAINKDAVCGLRHRLGPVPLYEYAWCGESRIVYLRDRDGDELTRLYCVDVITGEVKALTPFDGVKVSITAQSHDFPNQLIIAMNKRDSRVHDAYRVDLSTGELTLLAENPGNTIQWVVDAQFEVRGMLAANEEGALELKVRDSAEDSWRTVAAWTLDDACMIGAIDFTCGPVCFSADGHSILLRDARNSPTTRLVALDLENGSTTVIAADTAYDVLYEELILLQHKTREAQAVGIVKERLEWSILDESLRQDFERISRLREGDFWIASRDRADRRWVVGFTSDNAPISYYIYDRSTRTGSFLFDTRPELAQYDLASTEPFSFKSRDGLTVHGYITFPPGEPRKDLPLVLCPHGGPWHRNFWRFDVGNHWLANRGYICLQVNFRGSVGYGKAFVNAGDREWGGKMHDDLIDAVTWAVQKGYADPARVAVMGASYGGYSALVGASFTPDIFRCAVASVGPSNLTTFMNAIPPYWTHLLANLHRRIGNPKTDQEFLRARSPLFKVDRIKIPMLLVHGANDPGVKLAESDQMVEAIRSRGGDCEYLIFSDDGHYIDKGANRLKLLNAAETFLNKHMGTVRTERSASAQSAEA